MKNGPTKTSAGLKRQRIPENCRKQSYLMAATNLLGLVDNTELPNIKEELNV